MQIRFVLICCVKDFSVNLQAKTGWDCIQTTNCYEMTVLHLSACNRYTLRLNGERWAYVVVYNVEKDIMGT